MSVEKPPGVLELPTRVVPLEEAGATAFSQASKFSPTPPMRRDGAHNRKAPVPFRVFRGKKTGLLRGFGYTVTIAVSNRVKGIDDGNCLLNIKLRPGVRRQRSTRNGAVWTTQAKGIETPDDESASPNPERGKAPSGLVTQISAASLPKMVKPKPAGKKQDKSTCRAGRGRGASAY